MSLITNLQLVLAYVKIKARAKMDFSLLVHTDAGCTIGHV